MSDPVSALPGADYTGYVRVTEAGPQGMITLRADLASLAVKRAVKAVVGASVPGQRRIVWGKSGRAVAWMSPDEVLIVLPGGDAAAVVAQMQEALAGVHALIVDVSDARAVFTLAGDQAREVLAKLCPVDLAPGVFRTGEVRRTRAAQVPVAFWIGDDGAFTLICFRSAAQYMFDLLSTSARPGGEVGLFPNV